MDEVRRNSWNVGASARREFWRGFYYEACFRKYEVSNYVLGKINLLYFSGTAVLNRGTFTPGGYMLYMFLSESGQRCPEVSS